MTSINFHEHFVTGSTARESESEREKDKKMHIQTLSHKLSFSPSTHTHRILSNAGQKKLKWITEYHIKLFCFAELCTLCICMFLNKVCSE